MKPRSISHITRVLRLASLLASATLPLMIGFAPSQVAAQGIPAGDVARLLGVELVSQSDTQTTLRFRFAPKAASFGEISDGSGKLALGFSLSTQLPSTSIPKNLHGAVRNIKFQQMDSVLIAEFDTGQQGKLRARLIDPATVEVSILSERGVAFETTSYSPPNGARVADSSAGASSPDEAYELVPLQFADVSEVVGLLTEGATVKPNDTFTPRAPSFGSPNQSNSAVYAIPNTTNTVAEQPLGQSVDGGIGIDRRLNAILLKGSPERIQRLKRIIAAVDVPVESVILETEVVELSNVGAKALGIDLANSGGQIAVGTLQLGQFAPAGVASNAGNWLQSVSLQAAVYAQVQKGEAKIISRPRISAQNGSTAKIMTGDAIPILTSIALAGVNGISQQVQYVNVGVTLQIAPRISSDGLVSSHIYCVVSSVSGYSQGYPTINQREAETSATVREGESFVIGGLTQETTASLNSKVPLLGQIPILGTAFGSKRNSQVTSELYIIVTPHIVRRTPHTPAPA